MASTDPELLQVVDALRALDPTGAGFARTIRQTFDQLYDGQHTGRYRYDQLAKTEKTHMGSVVEINLQREFRFADGLTMDFRIGGVEVDCKWTYFPPKWMIPREAVGHLCLIVTGNEDRSDWSAGVVRVDDESSLRISRNQDKKGNLTAEKVGEVVWLWDHAPLPENTLFHIPREDADAIMVALAGPRRGQKRLNELFRRVPNRLIGRGVVATVAQQDDYMKRVRKNAGSRSALQPEGIVIFGDSIAHGVIAADLGLPVPGPGDSMSARLRRVDGPGPGVTWMDGAWFRLCTAGEDPTRPAPTVPET